MAASISRRKVLGAGAVGAMLPAHTLVSAGAASAAPSATPSTSGSRATRLAMDVSASDVFNQSLATSFATYHPSHITAIRGKFQAQDTTVVLTVDVCAAVVGNAFGNLYLATGVTPAGNPDAQLTQNVVGMPVASGVTEFELANLGLIQPIAGATSRTVVRTGLVVGRTYTYEVYAAIVGGSEERTLPGVPSKVAIHTGSSLPDETTAWLSMYQQGGGFGNQVVPVKIGGRPFYQQFDQPGLSQVGTAVTTGPAGAAPVGVAIDSNGLMAVANFNANSVFLYNTVTGTSPGTWSAPAGAQPYGVAVGPNPGVFYVSCFDGTLQAIGASANLLASLPLGTLNADCRDLCVTPDGLRVVVPRKSTGDVKVINAVAFTVERTVSVGGGPVCCAAVENSTVVVGSDGINTLKKVDIITGAVVATLNVGGAPHGVDVTADGYHWWLTAGSRVLYGRTADLVVYDQPTMPSQPFGIALTNDEYIVVGLSDNTYFLWPGATFSVVPNLFNDGVGSVTVVGAVPA